MNKALLIAVAAAFALTACGRDNPSKAPSSTSPSGGASSSAPAASSSAPAAEEQKDEKK